MDLKDFALHFNVTAEQQDFIVKYGFNEVADKLGEVPESLSESFIRRELAKLRREHKVEPLLAAAEEIKSDVYTLAYYNYICYYWWQRPQLTSMLYGNKLPDITQRPVCVENAGLYRLLIALAGFGAVEKSYASLGLPPEVAADTLQYINGAIDEFATGHDGKYGVNPNKLQWMRFYVDGKLFRVGRLEFMIQDPLPYLPAAYRRKSDGKVIALCRSGWQLDKDGMMLYPDEGLSKLYITAQISKVNNTISGIPLNPAGFAEVDRTITLDLNEYEPVWNNWDLVPGIHIPGGGGMTPEICRESLLKAREFFARYFKREVAGFSCFSWIYNTQFEEELPNSNLADFMRQVYLFPFPPVGVEGLFFVFGKSPKTREDWSHYPADNSLRKAFHRIRESGRRLRAGGMFIEAHGLENYGKSIYRSEYQN